MPAFSKMAFSEVRVLPLSKRAFKSFLNHLEHITGADEKTLAEYRRVWKEWRAKADAKGVVSIPKDQLTQELLRILTGVCCEDVSYAAEDIANGDCGLMLGGRVFVHPRAGQPTLPPGKGWHRFRFTPAWAGKRAVYTSLGGVVSGKLSVPKKLWDELNWQDRLVPAGKWFLVIEGTAIEQVKPGKKTFIEKEENTLYKLAELQGLGTGFLVTTMVTEKEAKSFHWIKVGVFLPLSQAALAHVPQLAADLREALCWLHLDKRINVSVRQGDPNGLLSKNHTGGWRAVEEIDPAKAQNFVEEDKGCAWKIPCNVLPTDSFSQMREFEEVVAAHAAAEAEDEPEGEPEAEPKIVIPPLPSAAELLKDSWADDDDEEDLEPPVAKAPSEAEPVAKAPSGAEPPVAEAPSVAEPVAEAPSVAEPVAEAEPPVAEAEPAEAEPAKAPSVAKKSKTRRGGATARKRRQRAQTKQ